MSGEPPPLVARCPAKVNLALRVLGRRADGYHELETVFQAIDLWDRIEARPHADLLLRCDDPRIPADASNLALRAAELLRARHGRPGRGVELTLRKAIPPEAGLGGGSSDAAGALRLCVALWELAIGESELAELASRLGADVPFFLVGGTARGTGRGDRVVPLPFAGELPIVLGMPPFGVSTAEVFRALAPTLTHPENDVRFPAVFALKWQEDNDFSSSVNELEDVVFPRWPALARFRDALREQGARTALLSGSGSTVYGIFADAVHAAEAARRLAAEFTGWRVLATRAVDGGAQVVRAV